MLSMCSFCLSFSTCGLLGCLPMRTKKPRLQKKPDRKELKGKLPTRKTYKNCSNTQVPGEIEDTSQSNTFVGLYQSQLKAPHMSACRTCSAQFPGTYLGCAGEESIYDKSVDDLQ